MYKVLSQLTLHRSLTLLDAIHVDVEVTDNTEATGVDSCQVDNRASGIWWGEGRGGERPWWWEGGVLRGLGLGEERLVFVHNVYTS